ncbi:MAG: superoxide dismutase family protein [Deltaproteobacteria bacterium]|nr:superoxide dismutase family protein [Deltaproteobacteria bacterium]
MKTYLGLSGLLALSALVAVPALAGKDAKPAAEAKDAKKAEPAKGEPAKAAEKKADDAKPCVGPDGKPCAPDCCEGAPTAALAQMQPTAGSKVKGTVKFAEGADGKVTVTAELEGLNPGQQHAFHVHEFGDCSAADGSSAGGHYNPGGHDHGLPDKAPKRHAGDLGNLTADKDGKAKLAIVVDNLTVGKKYAVIGRSVIVHAKTDDGGQPTGNAGGRIACGLIGVSKP